MTDSFEAKVERAARRRYADLWSNFPHRTWEMAPEDARQMHRADCALILRAAGCEDCTVADALAAAPRSADVISLRNNVRAATTDEDQVAALDALCDYLAAAAPAGGEPQGPTREELVKLLRGIATANEMDARMRRSPDGVSIFIPVPLILLAEQYAAALSAASREPVLPFATRGIVANECDVDGDGWHYVGRKGSRCQCGVFKLAAPAGGEPALASVVIRARRLLRELGENLMLPTDQVGRDYRRECREIVAALDSAGGEPQEPTEAEIERASRAVFDEYDELPLRICDRASLREVVGIALRAAAAVRRA